MVRAEGLPLWAFDDPPPQERAAIFDDVRGKRIDGLIAKRVVGDIFARIDARAAFPGILAACRAWGPDVVVSETTEFAGPLAAEVDGRAVRGRRHLPAGQGGAHAAPRPRRGRRAARRLRPCARSHR